MEKKLCIWEAGFTISVFDILQKIPNTLHSIVRVNVSPPLIAGLRTRVDRSHPNLALVFQQVIVGQGQRMNQRLIPLSCVRRLEEATGLPFSNFFSFPVL